MKRAILLAVMISLFSSNSFAQKAPKRQGDCENLNLESLYGNIESIETAHYSIDKATRMPIRDENVIMQRYLFNERGDVVSWGPTISDGFTFSYEYTPEGRMSKKTIFMGEEVVRRFLFTYLPNGKLRYMYRYEGGEDTYSFKEYYTYNERGQILATYKYDKSGKLIHKCLNTYNTNGKIRSKTISDSVTAQIDILRYTYDTYGRVVREDVKDNTAWEPEFYTYHYKYDSAGRKIESVQYSEGKSNGSTTYRYNTSGQLIEERSSANRMVYKYDSKGNITEKFTYFGGEDTPSFVQETKIKYRE